MISSVSTNIAHSPLVSGMIAACGGGLRPHRLQSASPSIEIVNQRLRVGLKIE